MTEIGEEPGSRRFRELLHRERQDMGWLIHVVAAMYDEISGGRISKPMTYPSEVIAAYQQRLMEAEEEAAAEARAAALADVRARVEAMVIADPTIDGQLMNLVLRDVLDAIEEATRG